MKPQAASTVLVLADTDLSASVLAQGIKRELPETYIIAIPFNRCTAQLTSEVLLGADLLITEMIRYYRAGIRAEGLMLARRRLQANRAFLILSPLHILGVTAPSYWDNAAPDSWIDRTELLLRFPEKSSQGFSAIHRRFESLLNLPPQH